MDRVAVMIDHVTNDILYDTLECIRGLVKEGKTIDDAVLVEVEKAVREYYGGDNFYCAKGISPKTLNRLVLADIERGVSRRAIALTYGITTKTIGTILKKNSV